MKAPDTPLSRPRIGCTLGLAGVVAVAAVTGLGSWSWLMTTGPTEPGVLGPVRDGRTVYEIPAVSDTPGAWNLEMHLEQPFHDFVMRTNAELLGAPGGRALAEPHAWDPTLYGQFIASFQQHAQSWAFFEKLDASTELYGQTVATLRESGQPEVFAAISFRAHDTWAAADVDAAWSSEAARRSGSAVEIAILSHRLGWDGPGETLRAEIEQWSTSARPGRFMHARYREVPVEQAAVVATPSVVIAIHALAVCYFGANYPEHPPFRPYRSYLEGDGYCRRVHVPNIVNVRAWRAEHTVGPDEHAPRTPTVPLAEATGPDQPSR